MYLDSNIPHVKCRFEGDREDIFGWTLERTTRVVSHARRAEVSTPRRPPNPWYDYRRSGWIINVMNEVESRGSRSAVTVY
jgi:hypothetical protein